MQRRIEFERFQEPFLPPDAEDDFDSDGEWNFAKRVFLGKDMKPSPYRGYYLSSPVLGFMPLADHNLPTKRHKLWIVHSTFQWTTADLELMDRTEGVDLFQVISPYRALLGAAFLFADEDVKNRVRLALCPPPKPVEMAKPTTSLPADALASAARRQWPHWAIIRLPAGKRDIVGGLTREEAEAKAKLRGGNIESASWESSDEDNKGA